MQIILVPDNTVMVGTTIFRFVDRQTASAALLEASHAFWRAGPEAAMSVLTTIAGNKYGAEISGEPRATEPKRQFYPVDV